MFRRGRFYLAGSALDGVGPPYSRPFRPTPEPARRSPPDGRPGGFVPCRTGLSPTPRARRCPGRSRLMARSGTLSVLGAGLLALRAVRVGGRGVVLPVGDGAAGVGFPGEDGSGPQADRHRHEGQGIAKGPGHQLHDWASAEPPRGVEPLTYALRGPARSARVVLGDATESRFRSSETLNLDHHDAASTLVPPSPLTQRSLKSGQPDRAPTEGRSFTATLLGLRRRACPTASGRSRRKRNRPAVHRTCAITGAAPLFRKG